MSLTFKHFDTRLNQWLHTDGNTDQSESIIEEKLDHTLLEFFFPDRQFSFGQMDEYSTASDLKNHPDNHVLLFSSKSRLLYGEPETLEVVNRLCPDRKDRGAYGSIFLGACKNALVQNLNILVVDDATGENGGIIENEDAWKLVGDCYGQISPQLYDKLTGRQGQENYQVVQHRFGWRGSDGNDNHYRFGKGTLRPYDLAELIYTNPKKNNRIDLILPLSSFKGTDKDNPVEPLKPQIKPGLYNQTIWLGEKSQSQQGKTSISQLLASFPQGIKDFVEELEAQAQELARIQDDPRLLAQLYCETYEKRKAIAQLQNTIPDQETTAFVPTSSQETQLETNIIVDATDLHLVTDKNWSEDKAEQNNDLFMYELIKADIQSGHYQLLETEKVKQELSRFSQSQWRDIALGRTITFDRGMIIPSKELKNGEIYVSWINEGEKVLNFRSPFLNSNGLCVSLNKHVEDYIGPDGRPLQGIIVVNDEDHKRIQARIASLKARGVETHEVDPLETESERQGRDFDGDCIGVARAGDYPNLSAEAEQRNLPENAYAPTVKLKKQSFYQEDGTQPDFEEIAIFMSDSISVGVINNQVTALEALESEIAILQSHATLSQQSDYLDSVSKHYQKLLGQENNEKNPKPIRKEYREKIAEIVSLTSIETRTPKLVERALLINRNIYRSMIEEGCFQNQIAVDMFKSSRAPEMNLIEENKRYLYRDVNYIKDKKMYTTYLDRGINPCGYSPIELLISQTNQYFQASQLESRPIIQFQDLFKNVEFTPQQKFAAILTKQEFDRKFNEANRLDKRRQIEQGPYAIVQTKNGAQIEITNLTRYRHPGIWKAQSINLKIEEIPSHRRSVNRPHQLLAIAQIDNETESGQPKYRPLGTVSQQSAIDNKLKAGMTTIGASVIALKPELRESQIKILFEQANAIAKNFYTAIPESQRLSAAAAAWSITAFDLHRLPKNTLNSEEKLRNTLKKTNQLEDGQKKISNFIFSAFSNEIISRLTQLQFTDLTLISISPHSADSKIKVWDSQSKYEIEIRNSNSLVENTQQHSRAVFTKSSNGEYKNLGILEQRTGRLPIGTKAQAIVTGDSYTATATLAEPGKPPVEFTIKEISKFFYARKVFNTEKLTLAIANTQLPTDIVKILIDDKVLGELDSDSVSELRKVDYLENNNTLRIKLKSIGSATESGVFVIGESPKGNLVRINKVNYYDFKGCNFNDITHRIATLELLPYKYRTAVFLNNKLLGVLHFNKDKETLKQIGLLKSVGSTSIQCVLQSNFSHSYLQVDPNTIEYPKTWVKEIIELKDSTKKFVATEQQLMIERSVPLLQKLKERPTILFSSDEDKVLGLVGLAVDNTKIEVVQHWLQSKSIEFTLQSQENVPLETRKGLAVIYLNNNTIAPQEREALKTKFGKVLDASGSNSSYLQHLNSLPNRPQQFLNKASQTIVFDKTASASDNQKATTSYNSAQSVIENERLVTVADTPVPFPTPDKQQSVVENTVQQATSEATNPLYHLKPINPAVATHMLKDVAMAEVATQFIGKSAAPGTTPSSTRSYEQAWGDRANTGNYSSDDTIMVSGSGPWRGVTHQQINETFKNHYIPLLNKAIEKGSSFVVGNAAGTDQLVQQYLQARGYKLTVDNLGYNKAQFHQQLSQTPQPTEIFTSSGKPESQNDPSLDNLRQWYVAAKELNKPQAHLDRITTVANDFKFGKALSSEAISAMQTDIRTYNQQLLSIQKLEQLSDREFLQLHRSILEYLQTAPIQPLPEEIQLVQDEVKLLDTKIKELRSKQTITIDQVELLQKKPFAAWSKEYKEAVVQVQQNHEVIERFTANRNQKITQLQQWEKQREVYQAWQDNPRTLELKGLCEVLKLPRMQERMLSLQQQANHSESRHQLNQNLNNKTAHISSANPGRHSRGFSI